MRAEDEDKGLGLEGKGLWIWKAGHEILTLHLSLPFGFRDHHGVLAFCIIITIIAHKFIHSYIHTYIEALLRILFD